MAARVSASGLALAVVTAANEDLSRISDINHRSFQVINIVASC